MAQRVPRIVPIHGGRVHHLLRDPSTLQQGEVQELQDGYYLPGAMKVRSRGGRKLFNSVALPSDIRGVAVLQFDGATDRIVVNAGNAYYYTTLSTSGSFTSLLSGVTSGILDVVQFENEYVLLGAGNVPYLVDSSMTTQRLGMLENVSAPTADYSGAGSTSLDSGKYLVYYVEERVKDGDYIVKRNRTTKWVEITGNFNNKAVVITRPAVVNTEATHWALYGSETLSASTGNVLPLGAEIDEVAIATTSITDDRAATNPPLPDGDTYELLAASIAGLPVTTPRNGPPPSKSTTGDIFKDSLLLNDSTNPRIVWFSWVGKIHAFPAYNFFRVGDTKYSDDVVAIRSIGDFCMVGCAGSIWRLNGLPRPENASFASEEYKYMVHDKHGIVGAKAQDTFDFGLGVRWAYVAPNGLHITDGQRWDNVSADMDWERDVGIPGSGTVLIDNPRRYRLEMYLPNNKAWYFHYHPDHVKSSPGGRNLVLKHSGPISGKFYDAAVGRVSGRDRVFLAGRSGSLYLDDEGTTDASGSDIDFRLTTGEIFLAGAGNEASARKVGVRHPAYGPSNVFVDVVGRRQGSDPVMRSRPLDMSRRETTFIECEVFGESLEVTVRAKNPTGTVEIEYLVVGTQPAGEAESK